MKEQMANLPVSEENQQAQNHVGGERNGAPNNRNRGASMTDDRLRPMELISVADMDTVVSSITGCAHQTALRGERMYPTAGDVDAQTAGEEKEETEATMEVGTAPPSSEAPVGVVAVRAKASPNNGAAAASEEVDLEERKEEENSRAILDAIVRHYSDSDVDITQTGSEDEEEGSKEDAEELCKEDAKKMEMASNYVAVGVPGDPPASGPIDDLATGLINLERRVKAKHRMDPTADIELGAAVMDSSVDGTVPPGMLPLSRNRDVGRNGRAANQHAFPGAYAHGNGALAVADDDRDNVTQEAARTTEEDEWSQSDSGLITAHEVNDDSDRDWDALPQAEEFDPQQVDKRKQKRKLILGVSVLSGAILLAVGCVLLIMLLGGKDEQKSAEFDDPVLASFPSDSPEVRVASLLPSEFLAPLRDATSPQSQALQWLVQDPSFADYTETRVVQRYALASLFLATNGHGWRDNDFWLSYSHHECEWHSIQPSEMSKHFENVGLLDTAIVNHLLSFDSVPCDTDADTQEQVFSHLWLQKNRLKGTVPQEIYLLTSLRSMGLGPDRFEALELSSSIGRLTSLEVLGCIDIELHGGIPSEIGYLSKLQHVYLPETAITGSLPTTLGQLRALRWLDLGLNQMSNTVPTELGLLGSLEFLSLGNSHGLTGTIPTEVGSLTQLKSLHMDGNLLTGKVPSTISALSSLEDLILMGNDLTGTLPTQVYYLHSLKLLGLHSNDLSGTLSTEIGLMEKLEWLQLENMKLHGQLPTEVGLCTNLREMHLQTNNFSGELPTGIWKSLNGLHLLGLGPQNQFMGPIPSQLGLLTQLMGLNLAENSFSGPIPSQLGLLTGCFGIDTSMNQLVGSIPFELDELPSNGNLLAFYLVNNSLTGTISDSICTLNEPKFCFLPPPLECKLRFDCSSTLCGCSCPCNS